jgi:hypothetical protein
LKKIPELVFYYKRFDKKMPCYGKINIRYSIAMRNSLKKTGFSFIPCFQAVISEKEVQMYFQSYTFHFENQLTIC